MKEIIVTDPIEIKKIEKRFFEYLDPGEFVPGLSKLSNERYLNWGSTPYTHIFLSCTFSADEEGYFGENKVRFSDDTYTDKITRVVEMSSSEFFDILTAYSHQYEEEHPEEKLEIEELLAKIKTKLNLD